MVRYLGLFIFVGLFMGCSGSNTPNPLVGSEQKKQITQNQKEAKSVLDAHLKVNFEFQDPLNVFEALDYKIVQDDKGNLFLKISPKLIKNIPLESYLEISYNYITKKLNKELDIDFFASRSPFAKKIELLEAVYSLRMRYKNDTTLMAKKLNDFYYDQFLDDKLRSTISKDEPPHPFWNKLTRIVDGQVLSTLRSGSADIKEDLGFLYGSGVLIVSLLLLAHEDKNEEAKKELIAHFKKYADLSTPPLKQDSLRGMIFAQAAFLLSQKMGVADKHRDSVLSMLSSYVVGKKVKSDSGNKHYFRLYQTLFRMLNKKTFEPKDEEELNKIKSEMLSFNDAVPTHLVLILGAPVLDVTYKLNLDHDNYELEPKEGRLVWFSPERSMVGIPLKLVPKGEDKSKPIEESEKGFHKRHRLPEERN